MTCSASCARLAADPNECVHSPAGGYERAMTIGSAIALIAVGAILKFAVTAHVTGFNVQTAGTVLLVVGIVGLFLAMAYTFWWADRPRRTVAVRDERDPRY